MPRFTPRATFTVVYRRGGPERCSWHRSIAFATREAAQECRGSVERMGYKALVHKTHELDAIGMPVGWEA